MLNGQAQVAHPLESTYPDLEVMYKLINSSDDVLASHLGLWFRYHVEVPLYCNRVYVPAYTSPGYPNLLRSLLVYPLDVKNI